ncbi:hypothetical protein HHK36_006258 [Tetracentron sinense]|uniref:Jacalin-type lectin domain-containing protein n=1 Tax=Tetracentron sinense TaxID=13715 RepID=A0A835DK25_TETSI|nr:hypothetical protein HHK36_006258 [Tetracentron sinense]
MEEHKGGGKRKTKVMGPSGGNGGTGWDDGKFSGVREITLVYERCIDSFRVLYDKKGKSVLAEKHGGNGGNPTVNIKLQYPEEFITSVSGHYCPVVRGGSAVIRSLTFKTNRRTFGPYGVEEGTPFSFPVDGGGVIVGFKGRSGWYLDAIGFSVSQVHTPTFFHKIQQKLHKLISPNNGEEGPQNKSHA